MLRKAFMAATVLLLLLLVLVTPRLIGFREDISSLPRVVANYADGELVFFITSLSGTYLYKELFLNVTYLDGEAPPEVRHQMNTYGLQARISLNDTRHFRVEAVAVDRRDSVYETSIEVLATLKSDGWSFELRLSPQDSIRLVTEKDLQNSPFASLLERRETP